jgi:hypothetical protein
VRPLPNTEVFTDATTKEKQWLNHVNEYIANDIVPEDDFVTWAAFNAQLQKEAQLKVPPKANIALLPLFQDNAHSPSMIKHAMLVAKEAIQHLNPEQIPVITGSATLCSG